MLQIAVLSCFALLPPDLVELEDRARTEEMRGEGARAVEGWKGALVKAAELARGDESGFVSAVAEAYAHKLSAAAVRTGRSSEIASLVEGLSRLVNDGDLSSRLAKLAMDCYLKSRRPKNALKLSAGLGFVTRWKLIGPFDNERSGGFDVAYEPENLAPDFSRPVPGKKRLVRWRDNPATPPDGLLDFAAVFTPSEQSLAYALTYVHSDRDMDASSRLATDDGFKVAEEDLRLRGPGELFGTRQHGLPELKVADLVKDFELLRMTRRDAQAMIAEDPGLNAPHRQQLRAHMLKAYAGKLDFLAGA